MKSRVLDEFLSHSSRKWRKKGPLSDQVFYTIHERHRMDCLNGQNIWKMGKTRLIFSSLSH